MRRGNIHRLPLVVKLHCLTLECSQAFVNVWCRLRKDSSFVGSNMRKSGSIGLEPIV